MIAISMAAEEFFVPEQLKRMEMKVLLLLKLSFQVTGRKKRKGIFIIHVFYVFVGVLN